MCAVYQAMNTISFVVYGESTSKPYVQLYTYHSVMEAHVYCKIYNLSEQASYNQLLLQITGLLENKRKLYDHWLWTNYCAIESTYFWH